MLLDQSSVFVDLQLCKTDHFNIKPLDELSITACFLHDCTILCSNLVKRPFLQPWSSFVCSFQAAAVSIRPVIDIASVELLEFYQKRGVFPQTQTDILAERYQLGTKRLIALVSVRLWALPSLLIREMKVAVVILTSEKMPTHFHLMVSPDFLVLPLRNPAHVLLTCVCVNKVNIRIPLIFFFFNPDSSIQSSFTMPRWTTVENWNWLPRKVCDCKHLLLCSY